MGKSRLDTEMDHLLVNEIREVIENLSIDVKTTWLICVKRRDT